MDLKICLILCAIITKNTVFSYVQLNWDIKRPAFDPNVYENALDSEICNEQLAYIRRNVLLRFRFLDSGIRMPIGILGFNTVNYGNFDQCLDINVDIESSVIEGKYCMIQGPLNDEFIEATRAINLPEFEEYPLSDDSLKKYRQIEEKQTDLESIRRGRSLNSRTIISNLTWTPTFRRALCVPKACTSAEGFAGLLFNNSVLGFRYEEEFCRFNGDKPWAPGDYVAVSIFSLIGLLTVLSTGYDLLHTFVFKTDAKMVSTLYKSFSLYTNGKRLTTFSHNPNNLNCVDGIRAISMFWIVAGHTYLLVPHPVNTYYGYVEFILSLKSLWITAAPFTVDTFFFLAGMLLVYTSVGKLSGSRLLKSLHLFYLNRLLRMFPLLATLVLLQASLFFRMSDGPEWGYINAFLTNTCRTYWWATLLYIQNYVNYQDQCILHSWYLAIDIQCYMVSPIVLYWVLKGKRKQAWISLICGVLAAWTIGTTYSFIRKFPGWGFGQVREGGEPEFQLYYYYNTLTRAPPFFVGMFFGYFLYEWKGKKPKIPHHLNMFLWILSGGVMLTLMYITHLMKSSDWNKWVIDDLMNSFGRSVWVIAIAWIIFACQHGYGGPVNWFLCLDIWKLPSRISYGMYLFHYHLQFIFRGHARQPIFFSDSYALYNVFAQILISYGVAFGLTLIIDSPCSVLVKLALGGGIKKPPQKDLRN